MSHLDLNILMGPPAARILLTGSLTRETVAKAFSGLQLLLKSGKSLEMNLSGVSEIDSAGVALIGHCFREIGVGRGKCSLVDVPPGIARNLDLAGWNFSGSTALQEKARVSLAESIGDGVHRLYNQVVYFLFILSEIFYHSTIPIVRGKKPRGSLFVEQMARIGSGSAPIVLLVSVLVGLTTALQAAYQLRQFGANIYIADLVSISMLRELGPLMAAILVAGRSGAAITAEVGTMKVNEEVDALTLLGISPIEYLGVPRFYAVTITQPLLGVTAAIVGIAGGFFIAFTILDINLASYFAETLTAVFPEDLVFNIYKSIAFGWIIVTVGIFYGLKVEGGAEGVGRATTNSVVTSIFLIIAADCAFSFI